MWEFFNSGRREERQSGGSVSPFHTAHDNASVAAPPMGRRSLQTSPTSTTSQLTDTQSTPPILSNQSGAKSEGAVPDGPPPRSQLPPHQHVKVDHSPEAFSAGRGMPGHASVPGTPMRAGQSTGLSTRCSTGGATTSPTRASMQSSLCVSTKLSKILSTTVNFRDVQFVSTLIPREDSGVVEDANEGTGSRTEDEYATLVTGVQKNKLIIIMVGLPARGKTFLCNKIMRYLNWLGHETRHFNVGQYRRKQKGEEEVQDASFFDHHNEAGLEARNRALHAALDDMLAWLEQDDSQVAIFDATNSTEERRQLLRSRFHGRWQYLMIETVCRDADVLNTNYALKLRYSPDYTDMDYQQSLADFKERIGKYEEVYETITDRSYHFIRLTDITTGRGHLDINRISGFIPGRLVLFLMQVCKSGGTSAVRKIYLTRHGQSVFNLTERLGGDSSISPEGEKYAKLLPAALLSRLPQDDGVCLSVWTSTLRRTIETARRLPFPKLQWKALDEIDAGACDGMTYEEIHEKMPEEYSARKKDKLRYRYPEGESYLDVVQRLEPVITEMEREREYVCVVAHQAVLRVVYGYFMGVPQEQIPSLSIPLHTLIELTPMPDGSMHEVRVKVDTTRGAEQFKVEGEEATRPGSPDSEASCSYALGETIPALGQALTSMTDSMHA